MEEVSLTAAEDDLEEWEGIGTGRFRRFLNAGIDEARSTNTYG
jgi:hypothetical protein